MVVEFNEVVTHDDGALYEQAAHAKSVSANFFDLFNHLVDADLDTNVVDFVTIVGADDVNKVFSDVVNIALHGGKNQFALGAALASFFHELFKMRNSCFHGFGALQNEWQLHTA